MDVEAIGSSRVMGNEGEGGYGEDMARTSIGAARVDLEASGPVETTGMPAKAPVIGVYRRVLGALKDRCCEIADKYEGTEGMLTPLFSLSRSPSFTGKGANADGTGVARGESEEEDALRKPTR